MAKKKSGSLDQIKDLIDEATHPGTMDKEQALELLSNLRAHISASMECLREEMDNE